MDIEKINEFIVLAQTCHFQTASEALYTTSSTLSKHISQMEAELGHQLFDRTTRKVTLTEAGTLFLEKCKQISALYGEALAEMNDAADTAGNTLSIAFESHMRQYGILNITYELSEQFPNLNIKMVESTDQSITNLLHTRAVDFAFSSRLDLYGSDIARRVFAKDDLALILHKDHPLANRGSLCLEELKDEPFIICNSYQSNERFLAECKKHGFTAKVKMITGNSFTALDAVSNNLGISPLSRMHYFHHQSSSPERKGFENVAMADIVPSLSFNVYLLYLEDRQLSPAMKAYLNYVSKVVRERNTKWADSLAKRKNN